MRLGRRSDPVTDLSDVNVVCAHIDAKLFGRLRLLSLETRVVAGKPSKRSETSALSSVRTPDETAPLERVSRQQESFSDLGRAVELWALSSEVLEGIRSR